jgi:hypothetical protein
MRLQSLLHQPLALFIGLMGITVIVPPPPSRAHEETRVGECFYVQANGSSVSSSDGCEIVGSMHQGVFCYEVRFNAKRQYIACGGHPHIRWEDAPASLNNKQAKFSDEKDGVAGSFNYMCFTVKNPFHKVCFR